MENLNFDTIEGFVLLSKTRSLYAKFLEKYKTSLEKMNESDKEAFRKRLEIMAYRITMYKYDKGAPPPYEPPSNLLQ